MRYPGLFALVLLAQSYSVSAESTIYYDWLTSGRVTGEHSLSIGSDGVREARFRFNDRGRGPDIIERATYDDDGLLVGLSLSGHSYLGSEINEEFSRRESTYQWQSSLEQGSRQVAGASYYVAADATYEQRAALARALLAGAESNSLALLPAGRAQIQHLSRHTLAGPDEVIEVHLYELKGLGLMPQYLWLDDTQELFAIIEGSMGMLPRGWLESFAALREIQADAEKAFFLTLTQQLSHALPDEYLIEDVNVVDVVSGTVEVRKQVVVRQGKIATNGYKVPEDFKGEVINAAGSFLIPGLWDMHTHISLEQGMQHIAGGVTTIRDMGNNPENLIAVRAQFDSGDAIGPHVLPSGVIEGKSEYSAPIKKLAESLEGAKALADEYAALGYPQIKIYSSLNPEWIEPLASHIHSLGMRLSGHIPQGMTAREAILAGFDEIQHINMLFLNFLAGPDVDTRTPARFTLVAERGAGLDLESDEVKGFVSVMQSRQTVVDPTVAVFEGMFTHIPGQVNPGFAMVSDRFPVTVQRQLLASRLISDESQAEEYADDFQALLNMIKVLHDNDIRIVAGTDGMPGFQMHRELELYVQAGLPAADVLRLATLGSAEVMGQADKSGSVTPGKNADMVLLKSNPLDDISAIRQPLMVFKGATAWRVSEINDAIGIASP